MINNHKQKCPYYCPPTWVDSSEATSIRSAAFEARDNWSLKHIDAAKSSLWVYWVTCIALIFGIERLNAFRRAVSTDRQWLASKYDSFRPRGRQ